MPRRNVLKMAGFYGSVLLYGKKFYACMLLRHWTRYFYPTAVRLYSLAGQLRLRKVQLSRKYLPTTIFYSTNAVSYMYLYLLIVFTVFYFIIQRFRCCVHIEYLMIEETLLFCYICSNDTTIITINPINDSNKNIDN